MLAASLAAYANHESLRPEAHRLAHAARTWFDSAEGTASGRPSGGGTSAGPARPSCPDDVAATLPAGARDGATLVAAHRTARFVLTLCAASDGQLYYHGVAQQNPGDWITLKAWRSGADVVAPNGPYRYTMRSTALVVTRNGTTIRTERYLP